MVARKVAGTFTGRQEPAQICLHFDFEGKRMHPQFTDWFYVCVRGHHDGWISRRFHCHNREPKLRQKRSASLRQANAARGRLPLTLSAMIAPLVM
jgi:hypothetical protein